MKSEFKAKFLQHLMKKKDDEGFTLIELLVVIIIIGILSAIALPSFLNQANKARESEAKQYVGSANRAEQAYYLEENEFTTSFANLGLGIQTQTANYVYSAEFVPNELRGVVVLGQPNNSEVLRAFVGGVDVATQEGGSATTLAILCNSETPGQNAVTEAINLDTTTTFNSPTCNTSTSITGGGIPFEPIE